MNPTSLPADYLPWLSGLAAAGLVLALLLLGRRAWERGRTADNEPEGELGVDLSAVTPPRDWAERADRSFDRLVRDSGLGVNHAEAVGWMVLVGVLCGGGLLLWRFDFVIAAVGLFLGMGGTLVTYVVAHSAWRRKLQDQLPDAYFLMARSLRAGLSLEQAIDLVGRQGEQPLGREFRRCGEHLRLGAPVPVALRLAADRLRLLDFSIFASMVTLYRQVGGNLALLLDKLAISTRDRNLFRGHVRAATALGRLSGLFIACAAPMLFLGYWLWQPEYIQNFMRSPGGMTALGVAAVLEIVGVIWLLKLFKVDY